MLNNVGIMLNVLFSCFPPFGLIRHPNDYEKNLGFLLMRKVVHYSDTFFNFLSISRTRGFCWGRRAEVIFAGVYFFSRPAGAAWADVPKGSFMCSRLEFRIWTCFPAAVSHGLMGGAVPFVTIVTSRSKRYFEILLFRLFFRKVRR